MKTTMLKMMRGVSIAAIGLWGSTAAFGNLLLNPSLELGSSNTQADNWTLHAGDTFREDTNSFGFSAAAMHDGFLGVKMFGGDGDLAQTNILVTAGQLYDVSGFFYHSSTEDVIANDPNSTRMFMHVEWFDSGGASLGNDYTPNHNGTSPADVWVPIIAQFAAPATAVRATFHVESDAGVGGGSVFGDSFSFVPEPNTFALVMLGIAGLLRFPRKPRR